MPRNSDLKAINCTNCGAGLELLGGGRITTHICTNCGSELDAQDNYKILQDMANGPRPNTPFNLGMVGKIHGVEYTIIGILAHKGTYGSSWIDHQIYSPTHGYATLTYEDRHLIFTRKYRKPVSPSSISVKTVETSENPPCVRAENVTFKYYDTTVSKLTFAEGEFNWRPVIGNKTTTVTAMSSDAMLGFSKTATERETERSVYLPQWETFHSFGVKEAIDAYGVHPLQPYSAGVNESFLIKSSIALALVSLILALFLFALPSNTALPVQSISRSVLPVEIPFEITDLTGLTEIRLQGVATNNWGWIGVTVIDPEDGPVFETGREVSEYNGYDDGKWRENNLVSTIKFKPEIAGTYTLELDIPTEPSQGGYVNSFTVRVKTGVSSPLWVAILAGIFMAIAAGFIGKRFMHKQARWKNSDWEDED